MSNEKFNNIGLCVTSPIGRACFAYECMFLQNTPDDYKNLVLDAFTSELETILETIKFLRNEHK